MFMNKIATVHRFATFSRCYASSKAEIYQRCYDILNVSADAEQETVRNAYIEIVKNVHPDSGHSNASPERFAEVDNAFRILQAKFSQERHRGIESPEVNAQDIKVVEYRVDKLSASSTDLMNPSSGTYFKDHAIKTKYGFDRVVEDLIQEAMSKGKFTNLEGTGKPLTHAQSQNPYVDFTQQKINKILLDNGFTPEWITMQKEIRTDIDNLNRDLLAKRAYLSESPICIREASE